jgi:hypothetical protein
MADIAAAREHVQKAVGFLVTRFGSQEVVFQHLTDALANLQDDPPPREEAPVAVEMVEKSIPVSPPAEVETETTVTDAEAVFIPVSEEAQAEPEPEPVVKPRSRGRRSRR